MPSVSQAQNRAMHAAAEGHSTLGIPQTVGQDFVQADQGRKIGQLPKRRFQGKRKIKKAATLATPSPIIGSPGL